MAEFFQRLGGIGLVPGLDEKARTQRQLLVYQGSLMAVGGLIWGSLCFFLGQPLPATIPYGYTLLTIVNFSYLYFTKNFRVSRFLQVFISLLLPVIFQALLGGFHVTGAVTLWALLSLVSSITFQTIRSALVWTGFYLLLVVGLGFIDSSLEPLIPERFAALLFVLNIGIISSMVVGLIVYFVWSRDRANEETELARRETETILHEVQEGLLLIDADKRIGTGFSDSSRALLGRESLAGLSFPDLIAAISETKAETVGDYLDLILARNLPARKIDFLNPLIRLRTMTGNEASYLTFHFRPLKGEAEGGRIFATITDVTDEVDLERKIKLEEEKSRRRIELISQILYSRPALIRTFLEDTLMELQAIDECLNANAHSKDFKPVLETIFRGVHSIKGNAALIRLDYFARICHELEESLGGLFKRESLNGLDLLEPIGALDNLKKAVQDLSNQLDQLENFGGRDGGRGELEALRESLGELAGKAAEDGGKQARLDFDGSFDPEQVSLKTVRTILVQLIRNAVSHGIESPEARRARNKPETGRLSIAFRVRNDHLEIVFEDDGGGFDLEKIRAKARESGEDADLATDQQLLQLLFRPGFSTANAVDQTAGRGIGLDILKAEVRQAGGNLKVRNQPGLGTTFTLRLPLVRRAAAATA